MARAVNLVDDLLSGLGSSPPQVADLHGNGQATEHNGLVLDELDTGVVLHEGVLRHPPHLHTPVFRFAQLIAKTEPHVNGTGPSVKHHVELQEATRLEIVIDAQLRDHRVMLEDAISYQLEQHKAEMQESVTYQLELYTAELAEWQRLQSEQQEQQHHPSSSLRVIPEDSLEGFELVEDDMRKVIADVSETTCEAIEVLEGELRRAIAEASANAREALEEANRFFQCKLVQEQGRLSKLERRLGNFHEALGLVSGFLSELYDQDRAESARERRPHFFGQSESRLALLLSRHCSEEPCAHTSEICVAAALCDSDSAGSECAAEAVMSARSSFCSAVLPHAQIFEPEDIGRITARSVAALRHKAASHSPARRLSGDGDAPPFSGERKARLGQNFHPCMLQVPTSALSSSFTSRGRSIGDSGRSEVPPRAKSLPA